MKTVQKWVTCDTVLAWTFIRINGKGIYGN